MKTAPLFLSLVALATTMHVAQQPNYQHPVIADHGGIVPAENAAAPPPKAAKVVFDITGGQMDGGVIKGLDRVALYVNLSAAHGVKPEQLKLAAVLHGDATKAALTNEAYARREGNGDENPNLALIRHLQQVGVEVYVCAQALAHHGYRLAEVAEPVTVAVSAATVNVARQMDGYAYIPFH